MRVRRGGVDLADGSEYEDDNYEDHYDGDGYDDDPYDEDFDDGYDDSEYESASREVRERRRTRKRPPVRRAQSPRREKASRSRGKKRSSEGQTLASRIKNFRRNDEKEANAESDTEAWVAKQELTTKAVKWGGIAALIAGPAALALVLSGYGTPAPVAPPRAVEQVNSDAEARASEAASQLVLLWLQSSRGQEESLNKLVDLPGQLPQEPQFRASDPAIAGITSVDPAKFVDAPRGVKAEAYSVTVAVWVKPLNDEAAAAERRYFSVPVLVDEGSARAASLPAPVAGFSEGTTAERNYTARPSQDHPVVASASAFLNAMLAGQGDLSRYVAPGSSINAIEPPLGRAVEVTSATANEDLPESSAAVTDGQTYHLLLSVSVQQGATPQESIPAEYALTMRSRAGRWEVVEIDPIPQQRAQKASRSAAESTSPSEPSGTDSGSSDQPSQSSAQTSVPSNP